jgi:AraC-like DNA-binding protein
MFAPMRHPGGNEPFRSARHVRLPALGGCELSYLHTSTGAAPPDMRTSLEVTLVDFGDKTVEHRGRRQRIQTGAVGLRSPYEVGRLVRRHVADTRVRVLAVGESEIAEACDAADLRPRDLASVLLYAPNRALFEAASLVFRAVEEKTTALEIQTRLATCTARVVEALGHVSEAPRRLPGAQASARRIREVLHDRSADDVSLDELAREVSLSRTYVVHAFQRAYGLSPFEYLMQLRVARARILLVEGGRPIDVAHACGFCDQSHLNRWFRKAVGVTPASYAASWGAFSGPATARGGRRPLAR